MNIPITQNRLRRDTGGRPLLVLVLAAAITVSFEAPATAAVYRPNPPWPDGVVPFVFDPGLSSEQEAKATAAMNHWMAVANITFRPRETLDAAWVHFRDSSGGPVPANYVGTIGLDGIGYGLGMRLVNIVHWEDEVNSNGRVRMGKFVVAHELGHILGLVHEQNRLDRDAFIRIEWDNVLGWLLQFNYWLDPLSQAYGSYDFDSVMQYAACSTSKCESPCDPEVASCRAITVLAPNEAQQALIGQRDHLSRMDKLTMSFLYPKSNWRFVDQTSTVLFESGTFLEPYHTFVTGINQVPEKGTVWIMKPQRIYWSGMISKPLTLRAPLGGVEIGRF